MIFIIKVCDARRRATCIPLTSALCLCSFRRVCAAAGSSSMKAALASSSPVTGGCTSTQAAWDVWVPSLWKQPLLNTAFLTSHIGEPVLAKLKTLLPLVPPSTAPVTTVTVPFPARARPSSAERGHLTADATHSCLQLHVDLPCNELWSDLCRYTLTFRRCLWSQLNSRPVTEHAHAQQWRMKTDRWDCLLTSWV